MNEDETPTIETYSRIALEGEATLAGLLKLTSSVPTEVPLHAEIVGITQYITHEEDESAEHGLRHVETVEIVFEWSPEAS